MKIFMSGHIYAMICMIYVRGSYVQPTGVNKKCSNLGKNFNGEC